MTFLIADTFSVSLTGLSGEEQKAVKTTAFDLQMNPVNIGMQLHKLDRARDKNFWSVRVNSDLRLIVHRTDGSLLLCYVGHHDDAYDWANRRKLETHPKTGAAQLVEIRERVEEIIVPRYVGAETPAPALPAKRRCLEGLGDELLLSYGVPEEWLAAVRDATDDTILDLTDHLPREAGEALLDIATGSAPWPTAPVSPVQPPPDDPFTHPDALRRFRVVHNVEELARALDYPWEKWTVFLHPAQQEVVAREFNGPARVSGTAGTGKTVVALHRAVYLARKDPDARVLLATFSQALANSLRTRLFHLIGNEPRIAERLEVHGVDTIARRLYERNFGPVRLASHEVIGELLTAASASVEEHKFSDRFLLSEWEEVVDAWQLDTWEAYRTVARLGRRTRLPEKQREVLWSIFEKVRAGLAERGLVTFAGIYGRLAAHYSAGAASPFDFIVVDEAQDVSVPRLKFFAALGAGRPNSLFFAGDLGQRIFQKPFSWKALGVDIRGRSSTLRINYRTSHQIRAQADRLLGPVVADVDGNEERRTGAMSVFNGPEPDIRILKGLKAEEDAAAEWLKDRVREGIQPEEIGVFVRSAAEIPRAIAAVESAPLPHRVLDDRVDTAGGRVSISTMHLAKGLEFRAVAVLACDDEIIPLQERIESVTDEAELEEVYNTERHLLYVACTRARDHLLVTSVAPQSEFLDDLREGQR